MDQKNTYPPTQGLVSCESRIPTLVGDECSLFHGFSLYQGSFLTEETFSKISSRRTRVV